MGAGRLSPKDWNSGDRCGLVEVVARFGKPEVMLVDLCKTALAGKTFKFHHTTPEGKRETRTIKGEGA